MNPALLRHRVDLTRIIESSSDGIATYDWTTVATDVHVFLDITVRPNRRDRMWNTEVGRAPDRMGLIFALIPTTFEFKTGDRLTVTQGPSGIYMIDVAPVEEWDFSIPDHLEIPVIEVSPAIGV